MSPVEDSLLSSSLDKSVRLWDVRSPNCQHRTAHLQWCCEHHNWTEQDWACVLFSDESRFSLSSDCRRQLIRRESGTAYRPENIQEKDRYPTCSIMVWAGFMINGHMRLQVVANGTMTGQQYIDEVLLPHVRLFRGAIGDKFVFMDDNTTCHRTLTVQDCLDSEGIQRLVWPARSPDLNPIENVWDALGRQVAGRNYPPTNKNTLIHALTEEWDKLPQQLLDNVVQSMGFLTENGKPVVCFDPEGLSFAVAVNSEEIRLYDMRSFDKSRVNSKGIPLEASFSPDSQFVFSDHQELEFEVNEDDIEELRMGHEDELTTELQEILNEEHQETQPNVSPSEQEEDERGPMSTSVIKDLLKKWEDVRAMVLECTQTKLMSVELGIFTTTMLLITSGKS
ncbi:transposable element Tcb2 transposase [Trichonephila clavipes]|nr:transposable element Tcb2 transposase [Trichonephila clavipes]